MIYDQLRELRRLAVILDGGQTRSPTLVPRSGRWAAGLDEYDSVLAPEYIAERFPGLLAGYRTDQ